MNFLKLSIQKIAISFLIAGATLYCSTALSVEVDVAVVYDKETNEHYYKSAPTAIISMVDQANTYLSNSRVDIQLNLVATKYLDIHVDNNLQNIIRNNEVQAFREATGADFVTVIVGSAPSCGLAYLSSDPKYAFNYVLRSCMAHSYLHELGHSMGLSHALVANDKGVDVDWGIGYGIDSVFSTNMAYRSHYNTDERTYLLSNPDYQCSGYPCGISKVADAAKALNDRKNIFANNRPKVALLPVPTPISTSGNIFSTVVINGTRGLSGRFGEPDSVTFSVAGESCTVADQYDACIFELNVQPGTYRVRRDVNGHYSDFNYEGGCNQKGQSGKCDIDLTEGSSHVIAWQVEPEDTSDE